MLVSSLFLLAAGASSVVGSTLDRRAADTSAVCLTAFAWTDSSQSVSPCRLAAIVSAACAGNSWKVPALNASYHYAPPTAANNSVNTCQCSWVAYNLFGACSICQGYESSVISWGAWSLDCGDQIPPTPFPKVPVADNTLFPYYATLDPSIWTDQRINAAQAQPIVREGHADVSQNGSTKKKSTPVGPIVGGVIGGLAAILIAAGAAFWIHTRKKKRSGVPPAPPSTISDGLTALSFGSAPGHIRQLSDMSSKSIGIGYQHLGNSFTTTSVTNTRGPASPTTLHTHTGSVNSLSYFGSVQHSVAPYSSTASPPPAAIAPLPQVHTHGERENIITPFTMIASQQRATSPNTLPSDRKRADGAIIPVYDAPDSLPSDSGIEGSGRMRMNPPAYSDHSGDRPLDSISQGGPTRPVHTKKGSADTVTTLASPISPVSPMSPVTQGTGINTHISGLDDMVGQFGLPPPTASGTGGTLATGQSMAMHRNQGPFRLTRPEPEEPEI